MRPNTHSMATFCNGEREMITGEMGGLIGGIIGGLGGLAGGVIGTYFSIRNTNGPRERNFVIKASAVCWVTCLVFLGLLHYLPAPHRWLLWVTYAILLPVSIRAWNKRQFAIRQEEAQNQSAHTTR